MKITDVSLKIILDSRGQKTVESQMSADVLNGTISATASVPSGKSRGMNEVFVLEPEKAVEKLEMIKPSILDKDFVTQAEFDNFLISLDGASNKQNFGGNLILALSLAFARLKAQEEGKELYEYIRSIIKVSFYRTTNFPHPIFNVVNGGAHASDGLDFQEFQVIPQVSDFGIAMALGKEFYRKLGEILENKFGAKNIVLGDEAGYAAAFKSNEEVIETLAELIEIKKYPLRIGLDVAATQFYLNADSSRHDMNSRGQKDSGYYKVGGKDYSPDELLKYYLKLVDSYNILAIEDPFHENDFSDFAKLLKGEGDKKDFLVITDDLTTTNSKRLEEAIKDQAGDAILVKLNQIGSLTETLEVIKMAYDSNWKAIISHRSGETLDDFIADLAVGVGAWGLKSGAPAKPERLAKYDRVLEIANRKQ